MPNNRWQFAQQAATLETARHSGVDWTNAEVRLLASKHAAGLSVTQIAADLQRTYYAVQTRLQLEGLTKPRQAAPAATQAACPRCWLIHPAATCDR